MVLYPEATTKPRIQGWHRFDGIVDILDHAHGASVLDLGCNRGLTSIQMALAGARLIHGCDVYVAGIAACEQTFSDLVSVESHFAVVDLSKGWRALDCDPFRGRRYDIILAFGIVHKIRRQMSGELLEELLGHLGRRTGRYFVWRATGDKPEENEQEMALLDSALSGELAELKRIHTSYMSQTLGVAAIWARGH